MSVDELQIANSKLDALASDCMMLSNLLEEIENFNGPKFIRVFFLWSKCVEANVSPFITRHELRNHLNNLTEMKRCANREALALYYVTH